MPRFRVSVDELWHREAIIKAPTIEQAVDHFVTGDGDDPNILTIVDDTNYQVSDKATLKVEIL